MGRRCPCPRTGNFIWCRKDCGQCPGGQNQDKCSLTCLWKAGCWQGTRSGPSHLGLQGAPSLPPPGWNRGTEGLRLLLSQAGGDRAQPGRERPPRCHRQTQREPVLSRGPMKTGKFPRPGVHSGHRLFDKQNRLRQRRPEPARPAGGVGLRGSRGCSAGQAHGLSLKTTSLRAGWEVRSQGWF